MRPSLLPLESSPSFARRERVFHMHLGRPRKLNALRLAARVRVIRVSRVHLQRPVLVSEYVWPWISVSVRCGWVGGLAGWSGS